MKIRAWVLIPTLLVSLSACDEPMERSLTSQVMALCTELGDPSDFLANIARFDLSPDGGTYTTDPSINAEIVFQSWVASTALGSRTTIWRGTYGPGSFQYSRRGSSNGGISTRMRQFERVDACVAHAPDLTRAEGNRLVTDYGVDTQRSLWGAARNREGRSVGTRYRVILNNYTRGWSEIEFMLPTNLSDTGVTIAWRLFIEPETQPEPEADAADPSLPG